MNKKNNLDKLKQLCDELTDRDLQLKKNASTLWKVVAIIGETKDKLLSVTSECPDVKAKIEECGEKLEKAINMVQENGCKRVDHEH